MNVAELLKEHERKDLLRFVTAGSVDDGKSTLIGRLLYESKGIYEDQLSSIRNLSARGAGGATGGHNAVDGDGAEALDLSLVTDGLKAEREQGITIDVAYRYFSTPRRKFIIADTPGHEQYTRNMATGASTASLIVILIDATKGVVTQSKRHAFIASLLGIPHFVVAVNKMDLVGYSQEVFESIRRDFADFAAKLEVADLTFIPVSALRGDNVTVPSAALAWHKGGSLLNHLETVHIASDRNLIDLRFPVQCALRTSPTSRAYLGTVASGSVKAGDEVMILPSGVCTTVKSVLGPDGKIPEAFPPLAAGITLAEEIDVSRGDMIVHKHNVPRVDRELEAMLVWMAPAPMRPGQTYRIKHATRLITGTVAELRYRVDVNTLHRAPAEELGLNEIGRCAMMLSVPVAYDPYNRNRTTGAFIVIDPVTNNTVGAGMVLDRQRCPAVLSDTRLDAPPRSEHVHAHTSPVTVEQRARRLGQHPACVWLTGLTGSGKTTLGYALERRLFDQGFHCAVLDGENVRLGFSHDLAFSADDRAENIRRTAEVARLFNDAGIIAICSLLSPYAKARELARRTVGQERFLDVYLSAPVEICRQRDTRGLYAMADRGEIANFSGVSAPYEPPTSPDLVLPTHELATAPCVDRLEDLLRKRGFLGAGR